MKKETPYKLISLSMEKPVLSVNVQYKHRLCVISIYLNDIEE